MCPTQLLSTAAAEWLRHASASDQRTADSGSWPDTTQAGGAVLLARARVPLPTQAQPTRALMERCTLSSPSVSRSLGRHLLTPQASLQEGGPIRSFKKTGRGRMKAGEL